MTATATATAVTDEAVTALAARVRRKAVLGGVVALIAWLYYGFLRHVLLGEGRPAGAGVGVACFAAAWHACVALLLRALYAVHTTDPGRVPIPRGSAKAPVCRRCDAPRLARAGHCGACGRCTRVLDHHCVWVDACIGARNKRAFLLFVLYAGLATAGMGAASCYALPRGGGRASLAAAALARLACFAQGGPSPSGPGPGAHGLGLADAGTACADAVRVGYPTAFAYDWRADAQVAATGLAASVIGATLLAFLGGHLVLAGGLNVTTVELWRDLVPALTARAAASRRGASADAGGGSKDAYAEADADVRRALRFDRGSFARNMAAACGLPGPRALRTARAWWPAALPGEGDAAIAAAAAADGGITLLSRTLLSPRLDAVLRVVSACGERRWFTTVTWAVVLALPLVLAHLLTGRE